jgi:hypothetical protein
VGWETGQVVLRLPRVKNQKKAPENPRNGVSWTGKFATSNTGWTRLRGYIFVPTKCTFLEIQMRKNFEIEAHDSANPNLLSQNIHNKRTRLKLSIPFVFDYESETQSKNQTAKRSNVVRSLMRKVINNGWTISIVTGCLLLAFAKYIEYVLN